MKNLFGHRQAVLRSQSGGIRSRLTKRQEGGSRLILLVLVAFLLGLGGAAFYFQRGFGSRGKATATALSAHTGEILRGLESPVEIRFYALLDPDSVPASVQDFAGRVDLLLTEYATVADGKLSLIRQVTLTDEAADAASADRIKPFNLDKGRACFLGLVVSCRDRKESMAQLAPEWEQALESDLTRAILRVASPPAGPAQAFASAPPSASVIDQVKSLLPNLASASVEESKQILREKALATFAETAKEMQARVEEAQQQLAEARKSGAEPDVQAALQQFQKIQAEQTDKLKQITAQLQDQITALEYLKKK